MRFVCHIHTSAVMMLDMVLDQDT